ncbi:MAG: ABC transporter ATP-binding protein [Syntrophobacteraceae bacterium]|nr:ABC transporter ATP-binding protein [Syntrophobacteraceae bacterium]
MRSRFSKKSSGVFSGDSSESGAWGSVRLLRPYFKRYWLRLSGGFASLVLVDLLQLYIPRIIKYAVDSLQKGHATPRLLLDCGLYIFLMAIGIATFRFVWRHLILGFSRLVETLLRNRMFSHLLGLDKEFFQKNTAGEVMALATNDLSAVQLATGMGIVALFDAVFMGLAAFGFMLYIDPVLTIIAVAPMPLLAFLTRTLSFRLHGRFKKVQEQFSVLTEFVRSSISSIRLVKAYNQEEYQGERFARMGETYVKNNVRVAAIYGVLFPVSGFISNLSMLLVMIFGGRLTIRGTISAGDFVAFISYLFLMTWPMMALGWVADLFQRGVTSLGRIENLMKVRPVLGDSQDAPSVHLLRGEIGARKLRFGYPGQTEPILDGLDLEIGAGTFLGIVGRTGSGKTTLCNLLARLLPVGDGRLFFDGFDVNSVSIESVRSAIAYVPQDVILFSDTIAFNIAFGAPRADREKIEKAARAAAIHEEIVGMPEGYETKIGEKGIKLSGGQRQRIAIARALLLDRPIIIIDDGLSAVDMETEHAIIRSIASFLEGRTCIIVSHRIAPVADADRIVVMENGRIADQGTHSELIVRNAFYSTIHRHQTLVPTLQRTDGGANGGQS